MKVSLYSEVQVEPSLICPEGWGRGRGSLTVRPKLNKSEHGTMRAMLNKFEHVRRERITVWWGPTHCIISNGLIGPPPPRPWTDIHTQLKTLPSAGGKNFTSIIVEGKEWGLCSVLYWFSLVTETVKSSDDWNIHSTSTSHSSSWLEKFLTW